MSKGNSELTNIYSLKYYRMGTYQWRRRVWRKAERPSMSTKMETVSMAQNPKIPQSTIPPIQSSKTSPCLITMFHNTSLSSENKTEQLVQNMTL
jgi:hypothetical protein